MKGLPDYAVNLRRLLCWHLLSNKEAAEVLGAAEHSVSAWVTGKYEPGKRSLGRIGEVFGVDRLRLLGDPEAFGLDLADPERSRAAEERIAQALDQTK